MYGFTELHYKPQLYWYAPHDKPQSLQWRHNERDGVSSHQPHDCLFNSLFRRTSKKTLKFRVTGLCVGDSLVTGEFPAQRASNAVGATNTFQMRNFTVWDKMYFLLLTRHGWYNQVVDHGNYKTTYMQIDHQLTINILYYFTERKSYIHHEKWCK